MKKTIILFLLCMVTASLTFAQDARTILDKASDTYTKAGAVVAKFTLNTRDLTAKQIFSQDGTAYMKGDKFKIEIPEAITWFDGKTQWTYIKNTEEVNISNPSGAELQAISPSILFSIYKQGFDLTHKGEKNSNGKNVFEIEMIAQKKNADLKKIIVEINKSDYRFSKIILYDINNMENTLIITSYQPSSTLGDDTFKFNKADYPDAEIVDLR